MAGAVEEVATAAPGVSEDSRHLCRARHADVLEWLWFLNTHDEVTYSVAHGERHSKPSMQNTWTDHGAEPESPSTPREEGGSWGEL